MFVFSRITADSNTSLEERERERERNVTNCLGIAVCRERASADASTKY